MTKIIAQFEHTNINSALLSRQLPSFTAQTSETMLRRKLPEASGDPDIRTQKTSSINGFPMALWFFYGFNHLKSRFYDSYGSIVVAATVSFADIFIRFQNI